MIAIVTGASSGLGREFVRLLDRTEKLEEIWVIARRRERLEALQGEVKTKLRPLALDLGDRASVTELRMQLAAARPLVRVLVSAAGFARIGSCRDISLDESAAMIDLNCRAAVEVTQACLAYMREGSRILQICSTAAFQPFQYLNVYAASKAFLYRYTRALRVELARSGIIVTAVCPYWIKDTEFIGVAQGAGGNGGADRRAKFGTAGAGAAAQAGTGTGNANADAQAVADVKTDAAAQTGPGAVKPEASAQAAGRFGQTEPEAMSAEAALEQKLALFAGSAGGAGAAKLGGEQEEAPVYIRHFPLASCEADVAAKALLDSRWGRAVSTPGLVCTLHRALAKFLPASVTMAGWEWLRRV